MEDLTFDAPDCAGLALEAALEEASVVEATGGEGGGEGEKG
jgi:hypothetical protein